MYMVRKNISGHAHTQHNLAAENIYILYLFAVGVIVVVVVVAIIDHRFE